VATLLFVLVNIQNVHVQKNIQNYIHLTLARTRKNLTHFVFYWT